MVSIALEYNNYNIILTTIQTYNEPIERIDAIIEQNNQVQNFNLDTCEITEAYEMIIKIIDNIIFL